MLERSCCDKEDISDGKPKGKEHKYQDLSAKVADAFRMFLTETSGFATNTPQFNERLRSYNRVFDDIHMDEKREFTHNPVKGDKYKRTLYDIAIDTVLLELSEKHPTHPMIKMQIEDKPYWKEYVKSNKK